MKNKFKFLRIVSRFCDKHPQLGIIVKYWLYTGITTVISIILYYILLLCFDFDHSTAYIIQYAVSVVMLFFLKFMRSQGVRKHTILPRMLGFFALYAVSMILGERALILFIEILHIPAELSLFLTYPITLAINTLGSRFIVFRDTDNRAVAAAKRKQQNRGKDGLDTNGRKKITESDSGAK